MLCMTRGIRVRTQQVGQLRKQLRNCFGDNAQLWLEGCTFDQSDDKHAQNAHLKDHVHHLQQRSSKSLCSAAGTSAPGSDLLWQAHLKLLQGIQVFQSVANSMQAPLILWQQPSSRVPHIRHFWHGNLLGVTNGCLQ